MFFYLKPKNAILSDLNENLINAYKIVRNNVEELLVTLHNYQSQHSKDFFLKIRHDFNAQKERLTIKNASQLIYLNKACFNGLYRVNKKGEFNVPYGQHKRFSVNDYNFKEASKLLKHCLIKNNSFENIVKYAKKGDFIYFDPPYYPLNRTSFTTYTNSSFLEPEQEQLAEIFSVLHLRGCKVMLSNSDTEYIRSLYNNKNFNITRVSAKRYINCVGEKRGDVAEVVVRNFK